MLIVTLLKRFCKYTIAVLSLLCLLFSYLYYTESGLTCIVRLAQCFIPGTLEIKKIRGSIAKQMIQFDDIKYSFEQFNIAGKSITLHSNLLKLIKNPALTINFNNIKIYNALINNATLDLQINNSLKTQLVINSGVYKNLPITAEVYLSYNDIKNFKLDLPSVIKVGNNAISFTPNNNIINISAVINQLELFLPNIQKGSYINLACELDGSFKQHIINVNSKSLINHIALTNDFNIHGSFDRDLNWQGELKKLNLDFHAKSNPKVLKLKLLKPILMHANKTDIKINNLVLIKDDSKITVDLIKNNNIYNGAIKAYKMPLFPIDAFKNLNSFFDAYINFIISPQAFSSQINIKSGYNNINGKLKVNYHDAIISGTLTGEVTDFSLLLTHLPAISRFKAETKIDLHLDGTINKPHLYGTCHAKNISITIPELGIKIKPMELNLAMKNNIVILNGQGKMRHGPGTFAINGSFEPLALHKPNQLFIKLNQAEVIKNDNYQIITNGDLILKYMHPNIIILQGNIQIPSGEIKLDKHQNVILSKDIKLKKVDDISDRILEDQDFSLKFVPNLNFTIYDNTKITGFGLNANISGELNISERNENLLGNGRITIKKGTYQIPGKSFNISKGRLLYPTGTLLTNPLLDIRMLDEKHSNKMQEVGIYVQGTLQKPFIQLHASNTDDKSNIATSLGLHNTNQISIQALNSGSSIATEKLKKLMGIEELGFESLELPQNGTNGNGEQNNNQTTALVVGKKIGKKLHVQYIQSLINLNQQIRLKFNLNQRIAIGVSADPQGRDVGADLSFELER